MTPDTFMDIVTLVRNRLEKQDRNSHHRFSIKIGFLKCLAKIHRKAPVSEPLFLFSGPEPMQHFIHTHTHAYIHKNTHTHTYIYIYIYIYLYIYIF